MNTCLLHRRSFLKVAGEQINRDDDVIMVKCTTNSFCVSTETQNDHTSAKQNKKNLEIAKTWYPKVLKNLYFFGIYLSGSAYFGSNLWP